MCVSLFVGHYAQCCLNSQANLSIWPPSSATLYMCIHVTELATSHGCAVVANFVMYHVIYTACDWLRVRFICMGLVPMVHLGIY